MPTGNASSLAQGASLRDASSSTSDNSSNASSLAVDSLSTTSTSTTPPTTTTTPNITLEWTLTDMGVDTKGIWGCYDGKDSPENPCWTPNTTNTAQNLWNSFDPTGDPYGYAGTVFAAIDIAYSSIPVFFSDPRLKTMYDNWQNQGSNPPVLTDAQAGLAFIYTVDGTAAHSQPPYCPADIATFKPPDGIQPFEYSFKYRLRLWNSRISQVRVWLCQDQTLASYPTVVDVTQLLAAGGYAPLMPGPTVTLTLPIKDPMNSASISTVQQYMCKIVWSQLDERCRYCLTASFQASVLYPSRC